MGKGWPVQCTKCLADQLLQRASICCLLTCSSYNPRSSQMSPFSGGEEDVKLGVGSGGRGGACKDIGGLQPWDSPNRAPPLLDSCRNGNRSGYLDDKLEKFVEV